MGRPPATSREELERVAFELFARKGFERTTVEDIASAAGIGRRTFFRYFATKNDVVWGDFDGHLTRMRTGLAAVDPGLPVGAALVEAIIAFNGYPPEEEPRHRQRMGLILTVAELQAHSTLQFARWRGVVSEFVAARCGLDPDDLAPRLVAHTALGAALAAYEQWLADGDAVLTEVLRTALAMWIAGP